MKLLGFLTALLAASPAAASVLLLGAGLSVDSSGPILTSPYAIAFGDSRTQYGGGMSGTTTLLSTLSLSSNGYSGWIYPLSGNRYLPEAGWNYGTAGQSTAGVAGRISMTGIDCDGYYCSATAQSFTATKATTTGGPFSAGSTSIVITFVSGNAISGG